MVLKEMFYRYVYIKIGISGQQNTAINKIQEYK